MVLIGDSIRMGYQETVRRELEGTVDVWTPERNTGYIDDVLDNLEAWAISRKPAVVQVNCGLHDLKRGELRPGQTNVPIDEYGEKVAEILQALPREADATAIWATTTPVHNAPHHSEDDVAAYNQAAVEVCARLGVAVNDLHKVITDAGVERLILKDGVHFTDEGYAILGKAVADAVRKQLAGEPG